jgi:hypothetical protein
MRTRASLALLLLALLAGTARSQEAMDPAAAKQKFKGVFKAIALPPAAQIEKTVTPLLPEGIVVDPGPFEQIAQR